MTTRRIFATCLMLVALVACAEGPEATWDRAVRARRDKDLPAFLACFTARTQKVLANLDAFQASTRKDLAWLKDPYALLPEDGPTQPATIDGNLAVMRVGSGKRELEAVLIREGGQWRIEGLELPTFWAPQAGTKETE